MKVDGKFMIKGQIPEGQATVTALLAECFDIVHELKIEYYDRDEEQEEKDDKEKPKFSVIGTKASQDTNYDYNHADEDQHDQHQCTHSGGNNDSSDNPPQSKTGDLGTLDYNDSEDNLASYANSINEDSGVEDAD